MEKQLLETLQRVVSDYQKIVESAQQQPRPKK